MKAIVAKRVIGFQGFVKKLLCFCCVTLVEESVSFSKCATAIVVLGVYSCPSETQQNQCCAIRDCLLHQYHECKQAHVPIQTDFSENGLVPDAFNLLCFRRMNVMFFTQPHCGASGRLDVGYRD